MNKLIKRIKNLKKSKIRNLVKQRIAEFKAQKDIDEIFKELCFCILTANFNAERTIKIQQEIGNKFLMSSQQELSKALKRYGHRFPNTRAHYIIEARKHKKEIINILNCKDETKIRNWLVKNVKGLGLKEASHFLRNIGYNNLAIIDFHILNLLEKYKIISKPETLTKKRYLKIEAELKRLSKKVNLNLGELDLYLWFMETNRILK